MNNTIQEIILSNTQDTPYISTLQVGDIPLPIIVTPDSLYLYQTQETDSTVRLGRCSITQFNKDGKEINKTTKNLNYTWMDNQDKSQKSPMTLNERVEFDLAELTSDGSISKIYTLVKKSKRRQLTLLQAKYRNKKKKDENFQRKEKKRVAKSQAKIFIKTLAELPELQELEKLISKRKKQLKQEGNTHE